jgi:hypothetical protein
MDLGYRIFILAEPSSTALMGILPQISLLHCSSDKERTPGFAEGSWRIYTRRLCLSRRQVRGTSDNPNITQKKGD